MSHINRREMLTRSGMGLGGLALAHLLNPGKAAAETSIASNGLLGAPHHAPRAKRVIYLFQSGGPSQMDLFDYKPMLNKMNGEDLPASVRRGQRLTGMSSNQARLPLAGSVFEFKQHGQSGAWISDRMPHLAQVADDLCFIKTLHTEAINHDPAITFFQTGSQLAGRPSVGAWLNYGLGTDNENLPAFCVLISQNRGGQPIYSRLWGSGFLPSEHQGVKFLPGDNPVNALQSPPGISRVGRRLMLNRLRELNEGQFEAIGDAEINSRIAQYEMAFRMQASVPDAMDVKSEPESTFNLYGPESKTPGTYAANCILARRLAERGVKFIQLYHQGWDQHGGLPGGLTRQSKDTDQPSAALVADLKARGLLEDTLIVWGGEFGRTNYSQGKLTKTNYGRDHHPRCFTMWMAGGGVKPGFSYGETDDFCYNIAKDPVHVHDFHATMMHLLGIDHLRLTFKYQGRRFRLTDIHGNVVETVLG